MYAKLTDGQKAPNLTRVEHLFEDEETRKVREMMRKLPRSK
jgi:hypothetical protein